MGYRIARPLPWPLGKPAYSKTYEFLETDEFLTPSSPFVEKMLQISEDALTFARCVIILWSNIVF